MRILNKQIEIYVKKNREKPTEAEKRAFDLLKELEVGFVFQHPIDVKGRWVIVDFCIPDDQLVIEINGGYHKGQTKRDIKRCGLLKNSGYRFLGFTNDYVMKKPDAFKAIVGNHIKYRKKEIDMKPIVSPPRRDYVSRRLCGSG